MMTSSSYLRRALARMADPALSCEECERRRQSAKAAGFYGFITCPKCTSAAVFEGHPSDVLIGDAPHRPAITGAGCAWAVVFLVCAIILGGTAALFISWPDPCPIIQVVPCHAADR